MAITRPEYILAIDQGTTGTRAVIFNHNARRVTSTAVQMTPIVPHTGWLEQRPMEMWRTAQTAIADALINAGIRGDEVKSIGIANQRETTIIWDCFSVLKTSVLLYRITVSAEREIFPGESRWESCLKGYPTFWTRTEGFCAV